MIAHDQKYAERFCGYCGKYRQVTGYWKTITAKDNSKRKMCPTCYDNRTNGSVPTRTI